MGKCRQQQERLRDPPPLSRRSVYSVLDPCTWSMYTTFGDCKPSYSGYCAVHTAVLGTYLPRWTLNGANLGSRSPVPMQKCSMPTKNIHTKAAYRLLKDYR